MGNYIYNGVEAPALPEYDKAKYPYAVLCFAPLYYEYCFIASNEPLYIVTGDFSYHIKGDGVCFRTNYYNGWEQPLEGTWVGDVVIGDQDYDGLIWSNFDIMHGDKIAMEGSDPVPVPDEPDTPDPTGAPISPYVRKNEAWQKQDAYKRVGSQWVKQAQDGYQAQGGQWSPL